VPERLVAAGSFIRHVGGHAMGQHVLFLARHQECIPQQYHTHRGIARFAESSLSRASEIEADTDTDAGTMPPRPIRHPPHYFDQPRDANNTPSSRFRPNHTSRPHSVRGLGGATYPSPHMTSTETRPPSRKKGTSMGCARSPRRVGTR
jgi:hypothetical protein